MDAAAGEKYDGTLPPNEKMAQTPEGDAHNPLYDIAILNEDYEGKPTEEELATLRRVPGKIPTVTYLLCAVEFCERASFYGKGIWTLSHGLLSGIDPVYRLCEHLGQLHQQASAQRRQRLRFATVWKQHRSGWAGNGGAGRRRSPYYLTHWYAFLTRQQNATDTSFKFLAYFLPLFVGYLADTKTGRYNMIVWGIYVCGVAHVLIVAAGAKTLLDNGNAKIPFFIGVYILSIGAGKLARTRRSTCLLGPPA